MDCVFQPTIWKRLNGPDQPLDHQRLSFPCLLVDKGEITATDEVRGNQIWSSGRLYAITRIATSPLGVFALDSDGKLLRFGPTDGAKNQVVQFEPAPTLRNGYAFGYYVAIDSDNQLLFVYLGDSAQLFAFHIQ